MYRYTTIGNFETEKFRNIEYFNIEENNKIIAHVNEKVNFYKSKIGLDKMNYKEKKGFEELIKYIAAEAENKLQEISQNDKSQVIEDLKNTKLNNNISNKIKEMLLQNELNKNYINILYMKQTSLFNLILNIPDWADSKISCPELKIKLQKHKDNYDKAEKKLVTLIKERNNLQQNYGNVLKKIKQDKCIK